MGKETSKFKETNTGKPELRRRLSFKDRTVRQITSALNRSHSKILTGPRLKRTIRPCSDGCEVDGVKTAVERGHRACVMKHLISDSPIGIGEGRDDILLLFQACKQPEILEMLLEFGCDVNAACPSEVEFQGRLIPAGQTPLHVAAADGNLISVKILLQYGANKEARDENSATPLLVSCAAGQDEVTTYLYQICLENKPSSSVAAWSEQTLLQASRFGFLHPVRLICEKGLANVNCFDVYDGVTPLMAASRAGHPEVVRYLLAQKNVDFTRRDKVRQWSAEEYARANSHSECLSLLLDAQRIMASEESDFKSVNPEESKTEIFDGKS